MKPELIDDMPKMMLSKAVTPEVNLAQQDKATSFALILPTLNASKLWPAWWAGLQLQTRQPSELLVIDSSSDDGTLELAAQSGATLYQIKREDFNHGTTRQHAIDLLPMMDYYVFLTQDAVLTNPTSLEKLLQCFSDAQVGMAYGRQLAREGAGVLETHARIFNYPASGNVRCLSDKRQFGMKTAFTSNSFAAYRNTAIQEIGGIPKGEILGEDFVAAAKLLSANWCIAYSADATVHHSHSYTTVEEFRRYFDIGVMHSREMWILDLLGGASGEGLRYLCSELAYALHRAPYLLPVVLAHNMAKFLGYRLGRIEHRLNPALKRRLSMHRQFWNGS